MRALAALLPLLLAGCLASTGQPAPPEGDGSATGPATAAAGSWSWLAPLPVARVEVACAVVDGRIVTVGGFTNVLDVAVGLTHLYDVEANAWSEGPPAPLPLHHSGAVPWNGDLYLFGGYVGQLPFAGLTTILRLDMGSMEWSVHGHLPRPRGGHATVLAGDEVFLVGGAPAQNAAGPGPLYREVDVYNLATGAWREGPRSGVARDHLTGGFVGGVVVAAGGRELTLATNKDATETLAPDGTAWTAGAPMPTARGGLASAVAHGRLFVFGGEASHATFRSAEAFDPVANAWTAYPPMTVAVHAPCAAATARGLHVIAGGPNPAFTQSNYHQLLTLPV